MLVQLILLETLTILPFQLTETSDFLRDGCPAQNVLFCELGARSCTVIKQLASTSSIKQKRRIIHILGMIVVGMVNHQEFLKNYLLKNGIRTLKIFLNF